MSETRGMGRRVIAVVGLALALALAASASAQTPESDKAAVDARIAALQAEIASSQGAGGRPHVAALGRRRRARGRAGCRRHRAGEREHARGGAVRGTGAARRAHGAPREADDASRAPPDRVREGGGHPRGAGARCVHRRATGRPRLPRLGVELRRDHRQRRADLTDRCPGSAHRAAGGEGAGRRGRRAQGDDRHETSPGRDGLRDRLADRGGACRPRSARR